MVYEFEELKTKTPRFSRLSSMHFRDENKLSIILYVDGNIVYFKSAQTSKS